MEVGRYTTTFSYGDKTWAMQFLLLRCGSDALVSSQSEVRIGDGVVTYQVL